MDEVRIQTLKTQFKVLRELHPRDSHDSILKLLASFEDVKVEELAKIIPDVNPVVSKPFVSRR